MILEYKLHMTAGGMKAPEWIEDGGYWGKSDHTMVGWSPDEKDRKYYIPDTVLVLTATDLENRLLAMHAETPMTKYPDDPSDPDPVELTTDEVKKLASDWVAARDS